MKKILKCEQITFFKRSCIFIKERKKKKGRWVKRKISSQDEI